MNIIKILIAGSILLMFTACDGGSSSGGGDGGGDGGTPTDTTAPQVESVSPADQATDVPADTTITMTFNEAINAVEITSGSFKVEEWGTGGATVSGEITYDIDTRTATFTPTDALKVNTPYLMTAMATITDLAGNPMDADYSWQFTTVAVGGPPTPPDL